MADEEEGVIICMRVGDVSEASARSSQAHCARCRAAIWLAATSRRVLATKPWLETVCTACGMAMIEEQMRTKPDEKVIVEPAAGALEEVAEHLARRRLARLN